MTPHYTDDWLTVYHGDARTVLAELPGESVHCVVTSPPYWGLRDYGDAGQLGLEPTPEQYVENMVAVFREVRRVLRSDGTVWLNLGDSYAQSGKGGGGSFEAERPGYMSGVRGRSVRPLSGGAEGDGVLKPKDLVGIPWRVAFALQQPYYVGTIPDERDRTWLAALVDGEGTFTILSTTSPSASVSYPPIVQVRMTSAVVVGKAASLVGVASPAQYPPSGTGRAVYQWRLSGRRAADVARELYPYLLEKRKQALIVWNHQAVRESYETKRGVRMPAEAVAAQRVCRDLIRRLNHGEHVDIPSWMVEPPSLMEPGWYLRSDVIWSKPNPMPESVTDRPTKSHEYLFLLSKSARYYYDADAVREPHTIPPQNLNGQPRTGRVAYGSKGNPEERKFSGDATWLGQPEGGRNLRSVWSIATAPYPGAHFATFPPKLVEPCIKAGTSEKGVCPECGAPWVREVERERTDSRPGVSVKLREITNGNAAQTGRGGDYAVTTIGWQPTCRCVRSKDDQTGATATPLSATTVFSSGSGSGGGHPASGPPADPSSLVPDLRGISSKRRGNATTSPAVVLDPFAGSGTTGMVAQSLSRRAVLIDLSMDYLDQLMKRNRDIPLGLTEEGAA